MVYVESDGSLRACGTRSAARETAPPALEGSDLNPELTSVVM